MDSFNLIPKAIDVRALSDPNGLFALSPLSKTTYDDGYQEITNLQLATAVNFTAELLMSAFGRSDSFETLAYIGPNDIRYYIVLSAGIKAGYKVFLPSPRNSEVGQRNLLKALDCDKVVTPDPDLPAVAILGAAAASTELQKLVLPSLPVLLSLNPAAIEHVSFNKTLQESKDEPALVLHTSGSTGLPKPIVYTHAHIFSMHKVLTLPSVAGHVNLFDRIRGRVLSCMPSFHIAGYFCNFAMPLYLDCIVVYPLPHAPPSARSLVDACLSTRIDAAVVPPLLVEQLAQAPDLLQSVRGRVDTLLFAGGSVADAAGDVVARQIDLRTILGSSECGGIPLLIDEHISERKDMWSYLKPHPAINMSFEHRMDDLYEMVQRRNTTMPTIDPETSDWVQPVFQQSDSKIFSTKDLYKEHPEIKGYWKHMSRLDDIIVFATGEKTNPVSFEQEVAQHADVQAALVYGVGKFEAALLIELNLSSDIAAADTNIVIERLWPIIESANTKCPAHARISPSRILFTTADLPMARAGKGTVQRQATIALYKDKLEQLYQNGEDPLTTNSKAMQLLPLPEAVKTAVQDVIKKNVANDEDFFAIGMDSLQALQLCRRLKAMLPHHKVVLSDIYAHSSIARLMTALQTQGTIDAVAVTDQDGDIVSMTLERYKKEIDSLLSAGAPVPSQAEVSRPAQAQRIFLLTGSTGSLGSYLLDHLLGSGVKHIYCLNRSVDSERPQRERNLVKGLSTDLTSSNVTFLTVDLTATHFGLDPSIYEQLLSDVTDIIHNAWPVDFNKSLSHFEGSLDTILGLISFVTRSSRAIRVGFISSISSVQRYSASSEVPETIITEADAPASTGYGRSKYIAERMLNHASSKLQLDVRVMRVGQIAGDAIRMIGWGRQEWFPSLVISSLHLHALPLTLGHRDTSDDIEWIPIDAVAKAILELMANEASEAALEVFHLVHPTPCKWSELRETVWDALQCSSHADVALLSYAEWLSLLHQSSDKSEIDADTLRANPAVKLLDFYESLQASRQQRKLSTKKSRSQSTTLRRLSSMRREAIEGWIQEWLAQK